MQRTLNQHGGESVAPGGTGVDVTTAGDGGMVLADAEQPAHGALPPLASSSIDVRPFVRLALATALVLMLLVACLNAVVDPYDLLHVGLFPTAVERDRTTKIALIEALRQPPQVVILGSSRSRTADPRELERLAGLRSGFNASVTSGDSIDEWVLAHLLQARFPHARPRYLLFVNARLGGAGVSPQLAADRRAWPYLRPWQRRSGLALGAALSDYLSLQALRDSLRVLHACAVGYCRDRQFRSDGALLSPSAGSKAQVRRDFLRSLRAQLAALPAHPSHRPPSRADLRAFVRLLRWMNARGATPLVAMDPMQPAYLRALRARDRFWQHRWAVSYLHRLQRRLRFRLIDLTDVRSFGGLPHAFSDPTHVTADNMRRMLRYIVAHDGGVLRRGSATP